MGMEMESYFFFLLPLLFVAARSRPFNDPVDGDFEKVVLDLHKLPWKEHKANCIFQKPRVEKGATTLEMYQRDYCSNNVTDWNKNRQTRIINDAVHVKSLQARFKSKSQSPLLSSLSDSQIPLSSGARHDTLDFIVTVAIGGRNHTLLLDTGSDLTWVQCHPCRLCYAQRDPLFDPSSSPSYRPLPCNSTTCSALQTEIGNTGTCPNRNRNRNSTSCTYAVTYGDGSTTRGELGLERLNFGTTVIDNFLFGCGRDNQGLFGATSGLMGLSRSELSIVYQTSSVFGQVFSYCLPSDGAGGSGSLTMGAGDFSSFRNVSPISYTRMIHLPDFPGFYFLNVTGISVGGVKLDVPRFGSERDMSIIDTGTLITRLPPSIYRALKMEFEKQFSGFPKAASFEMLDTCFDLRGHQNVKIPMIKFHFEGNGELELDPEGSFYFVKSDASQVCLAIGSLSDENDIGMIGSYQQKNQRVVYDLKESKLGFAREPCSF